MKTFIFFTLLVFLTGVVKGLRFDATQRINEMRQPGKLFRLSYFQIDNEVQMMQIEYFLSNHTYFLCDRPTCNGSMILFNQCDQGLGMHRWSDAIDRGLYYLEITAENDNVSAPLYDGVFHYTNCVRDVIVVQFEGITGYGCSDPCIEKHTTELTFHPEPLSEIVRNDGEVFQFKYEKLESISTYIKLVKQKSIITTFFCSFAPNCTEDIISFDGCKSLLIGDLIWSHVIKQGMWIVNLYGVDPMNTIPSTVDDDKFFYVNCDKNLTFNRYKILGEGCGIAGNACGVPDVEESR